MRQTLGEWSNLDDNVLLGIASYLPAQWLVTLGSVNWTCFVIANKEELWRDLVLLDHVDDKKVGQFCFKGSWKATYVTPDRSDINNWRIEVRDERVNCSALTTSSSINFLTRKGEWMQPPSYALTLAQKPIFIFYNIAGLNLSWFPMNLTGVDRRHKLSREEFVQQYEIPNIPVIITGMMDEWPAMTKWKLNNLCQTHPNMLLKTNGRSTNGKRFRMKLFDFMCYCERWNGEKPLYIFDKKIVASDSELLKDYTVPEIFPEDLFDLMEDEDRPDYRWLLIGPNGSGSPFHTDPHNSSAWNAVIEGCKRVSFYHPDVVPPGVDEELIHSDYYPSEDTMDWYRNIFPSLPSEQRPIECLVQPGEILFIPSGWWHQVQNIGHTIAVTQNYCSLVTFPRVAAHMNAHAGKSVKKDFKIALSESQAYHHLSTWITVNKKKRELAA